MCYISRKHRKECYMITLQSILKSNSEKVEIPDGMQERLLQKILNWIETMRQKTKEYKENKL